MAVSAGVMPLEGVSEKKIKRFDVHQIFQHGGLAVSFVLLVLTGLPLKFNAWAASQWWVGVWGGIDVTRGVHHFAAWVMVFACLYHVGYLIFTLAILKRPFPVKMIPNISDFNNLLTELRYFVGISKERPQFDRFNWREKFDYWAMFWGIPVMVGTGFVLMFPVLVTQFLPGWIVPAALVAHSDEAMLALTWIVIVHIFFNHFAPGIFPMNKSIFTGNVSYERYKIDHPVEYQEMVETGKIEDQK